MADRSVVRGQRKPSWAIWRAKLPYNFKSMMESTSVRVGESRADGKFPRVICPLSLSTSAFPNSGSADEVRADPDLQHQSPLLGHKSKPVTPEAARGRPSHHRGG